MESEENIKFERYPRINFSGDFHILEKIVSHILKKGYELDGQIVHVGDDKYEIPYSYCTNCFMEGSGYIGLFWLENGEVKDKSKATWMS